jgi:hypothetical protein
MPADVESMFPSTRCPGTGMGMCSTITPEAGRRPVGSPGWTGTGHRARLRAHRRDGQPVYEPVDRWKRITRSDNGVTLSLNRDPLR